MGVFKDILATVSNSFRIGLPGGGERLLKFYNGFTGNLSWTPTADRTLVLPDRSGNLFVESDIAEENQVRLFSDFVFTFGDFAGTAAGTGSAARLNYGGSTLGRRVGVAELATGTTATGTARVSNASGAVLVQFLLSYGRHDLASYVSSPILSTSAETFIAIVGMLDTVTIASIVNSIYFSYTHANSSGAWECVVKSSAGETRVSSGITVVAGQWYLLQIVVNAAGNQIQFVIDRTVVQTITTNIPTNTTGLSPISAVMTKTVGVTSRSFLVDFLEHFNRFTTPRA
jgi:hypothetical protein